MTAAQKLGNFLGSLCRFSRPQVRPKDPHFPARPRIGLALGRGFAGGIAHAGGLDVFDRCRIPTLCITGVSAKLHRRCGLCQRRLPCGNRPRRLRHAFRRCGPLES